MRTIDADLFLDCLIKGHEEGTICGPEDVEELVKSMPTISQRCISPVDCSSKNDETITISIHQSKKAGMESSVSIKFPYGGQLYGTYITFKELELSNRLILNACEELLFCYREAMSELCK